ncbi:hypothetical protein ASE03_12155 [Kitasatospora sp. Root187]|nr:hypothetical protein ASC99_13340 [Kitasatospora sp. Root107]KRB61069.1 hypothetical protein ASE03_12155 [Kitasatospora sp. Root187]
MPRLPAGAAGYHGDETTAILPRTTMASQGGGSPRGPLPTDRKRTQDEMRKMCKHLAMSATVTAIEAVGI